MFPRRDLGVVKKCPHCASTDIPKKNIKQITCGERYCREKQNQLARNRRVVSQAQGRSRGCSILLRNSHRKSST